MMDPVGFMIQLMPVKCVEDDLCVAAVLMTRMRKIIAQIYINVGISTELVLKYLMGPKNTLNATKLQILASLIA